MKRGLVSLLVLLVSTSAYAQHSFDQLTTGNGFGFAVFDAKAQKVTQFLEHPYRYLHAGADPRGEGAATRNLAYDVYFGLRAIAGSDTTAGWLPAQPQTEVGYVDQSGIIRAQTTLGGLAVESFYFEPYGYAGNALILLLHVTNPGSTAVTVDAFANPNFHMGASGPPGAPGADGEHIRTAATAVTETGNGAGAMVYLPLGGFDAVDCSGEGYANVMQGKDLDPTHHDCDGDDLTGVIQRSLGSVAPKASVWWGVAIGFADDAALAPATEAALTQFIAGRPPQGLLADAEAEWTAFRKPPPKGLSEAETRVWRQAESTLRMAQVLEPYSASPRQKAYGMILASLAPGQWHIGWVRDAAYSIVALTRMGHFAEARRALEFFLDADVGDYQSYVGGPYRISVTRYFGDGTEEADWNQDGPNVELDGWGLYLWAARAYVEASGDAAWLTTTDRRGEQVYEVLRDLVASPLADRNVDAATGLIDPDTSIWESHWNNRKHFTYTSLAATRGLCDFAALATRVGDTTAASHFELASSGLRGAIRAHLTDANLVLGGSLEGIASGRYHDGSVVEAFNWGLMPTDDDLGINTLNALSLLRVASGGYERNDNAQSSYDSSEWLMIDLRAADALRRAGRVARADDLLAEVTSRAEANYDLLPELFDPTPGPTLGNFSGAVPMVGFGAGAYVLALADRASPTATEACGGDTVTPTGARASDPVAPAAGGCSYAPTAGPGAFLFLALFELLLLGRRRRFSL